MNTFRIGLIVLLLFGIVGLAKFISLQDAAGQFQVPASAGTTKSYTTEQVEQLNIQQKTDECKNGVEQKINSGSMEPEYEIGETVIVDVCYNFYDVEKGDVIVFIPDDTSILPPMIVNGMEVPGEARVIMHRVVDIETFEDGSRFLIAKGDANQDTIKGAEDQINESDFVGKVRDE